MFRKAFYVAGVQNTLANLVIREDSSLTRKDVLDVLMTFTNSASPFHDESYYLMDMRKRAGLKNSDAAHEYAGDVSYQIVSMKFKDKLGSYCYAYGIPPSYFLRTMEACRTIFMRRMALIDTFSDAGCGN